jgi:hypothetical protein
MNDEIVFLIMILLVICVILSYYIFHWFVEELMKWQMKKRKSRNSLKKRTRR